MCSEGENLSARSTIFLSDDRHIIRGCVVHVKWLWTYLSLFKYFLVCVSLFNFIHCAKTAVVYSRRPPGVFFLNFILSMSVQEHFQSRLMTNQCLKNALRFLWLVDLVVELLEVNKPNTFVKLQAESSKRVSYYRLSRLNWAEYEQRDTTADVKNKYVKSYDNQRRSPSEWKKSLHQFVFTAFRPFDQVKIAPATENTFHG